VKGNASRATVAAAADALLAADGIQNTWLDLLDGNDDVDAAVKRCIRDGVNTAEGEEIFGSKI
jgi:hypothetical protein